MRQPQQLFRIQTRRNLGIFQLMGVLNLDIVRRVRSNDRDELRRQLEWFGNNLSPPPPEVYFCTGGLRAYTWFRTDSGEMLGRALSIARLAREYGHRTRMLRTRNPGIITYQDDWQIVAHTPEPVGLVMPIAREPRMDRETIRRARRERASRFVS